uniref:Uncharacterized protein n=1 Tax=Haemonchus contortus TaxID=6289 RepID=A0A7I4Y4X7_HAECO
MNQVQRCYELSGPVLTSQWTAVEEQVALSAAGATELTIPGYSHQITSHFSVAGWSNTKTFVPSSVDCYSSLRAARTIRAL